MKSSCFETWSALSLRRTAAVLISAVLLGACGQAPSPETAPSAKQAESKPEPPKITQFYVSPGVVAKGEEVTMCYGVENAESVRLDPPIREIRPARNRCFAFAPRKTGIYKLIATGPGGSATEELAIKVEPAPRTAGQETSLITMFLASSTKVTKGTPVTLCYSLEGVESAAIDPPVRELDSFSSCFAVRLDKTTTFTLKVSGQGRRESKSLTITVE